MHVFSNTKQREESIMHKLDKVREYCLKNGFELVEEYIDEAQSATTDKRIRFQEMINDAEFADWRYIVVYKFDRLSRNVSDAFHYKKHLLKLGKQIISVIEDFDSNTLEGGFFNLISMGMSEFYVNNMRREIIAGLMQNARSARATGGISPLGYGYGKDQKHFVIEHEAEAVRLIFQMVADGYSYKDIAKTLNEKG
jgi:site-specific DNA recombinase